VQPGGRRREAAEAAARGRLAPAQLEPDEDGEGGERRGHRRGGGAGAHQGGADAEHQFGGAGEGGQRSGPGDPEAGQRPVRDGAVTQLEGAAGGQHDRGNRKGS
jgi:hypothetical protein